MKILVKPAAHERLPFEAQVDAGLMCPGIGGGAPVITAVHHPKVAATVLPAPLQLRSCAHMALLRLRPDPNRTLMQIKGPEPR